MEPSANVSPVVAIVGQTASGKSSMAMELACKFGGEIICADSRTVYKGMNIGTAKPSPEDQRKVPHHLLDIATPDHPITVADFKRQANQAIDDIASRGKVPFLVGGTGLYIDAVLFNFSFRPQPDLARRQQLLGMSVQELQQIIEDMNIPVPENNANSRHLIRQIESGGSIAKKESLRMNSLLLGIVIEREEIKTRIKTRLEAMFTTGLEEEVRKLGSLYSWDCRALQTIGYQEFRPYFEGYCSIDDVKEAVLRHTLQYAKRQKTWFKRSKHIHYIRDLEESVDLITTLLNKRCIVE